MTAREILGTNLRLFRQDHAFSQEDLAAKAQIDRTYVSALERGVYGATVDILDRLAAAFGVEAWELLKPRT